jgi:hypothetical protein
MTVTFKQAQKIVQDYLGTDTPFMVADWGLENDKYWMMMVGLEQWLVDHDRDYQLVDDVITLVNKETGKVTETTHWTIQKTMDSFTQVGPVPDFFKLDPEDQD